VTRTLVLAALCLALGAPPAHAQLEALTPAPVLPGKDVAWVPTPDAAADRMLSMAQVGPRDLVVDLGSGDGKIAIMAARRFGARAVGVEYDPAMLEVSREAARREGVADRVRFAQGDLFEYDFREATVVTLYLLTTINVKLRPRILAMRPGTRVASHMFRMGDWEPDERDRVAGSDVFLWIVPARVAGAWRLTHGADTFTLDLQQSYQRVTGTVRHARGLGALDVTLRGADVRVAFDDAAGVRRTMSGRVDGERMQGEGWRAVRVSG
jgi:SAM-dependent methyltransferase